jgi:hypothetical protein
MRYIQQVPAIVVLASLTAGGVANKRDVSDAPARR